MHGLTDLQGSREIVCSALAAGNARVESICYTMLLRGARCTCRQGARGRLTRSICLSFLPSALRACDTTSALLCQSCPPKSLSDHGEAENRDRNSSCALGEDRCKNSPTRVPGLADLVLAHNHDLLAVSSPWSQGAMVWSVDRGLFSTTSALDYRYKPRHVRQSGELRPEPACR